MENSVVKILKDPDLKRRFFTFAKFKPFLLDVLVSVQKVISDSVNPTKCKELMPLKCQPHKALQ